jgi:hypothetical protein
MQTSLQSHIAAAERLKGFCGQAFPNTYFGPPIAR